MPHWRTVQRQQCLSRLAKLQAKLEAPDWEMDEGKELQLLVQIQTGLSLMLHDLGVLHSMAEDFEISKRLDQERLS
jgi:hypothetical protein